jgi:hypothetical protein
MSLSFVHSRHGFQVSAERNCLILTSGSALRLHVNEVAETLRFRTCVSSLALEMAEEYRIRIEHRDYLSHDLRIAHK